MWFIDRLCKGIIYILILSVFLQGCKQKEKIAVPKRIKRYSVGKVVKLVTDNSLKYETLSVKKLTVSYSNDDKSISIAAASIIAKVTRDRLMNDLSNKFPEYKWHQNAGYGTKEHKEAIIKHGRSVHHRKSFKVKGIV